MLKEDAILIGPCIGEFFWEIGRFAAMLPFYKAKKFKNKNIKFIILTRQDRFDMYGAYADILVPLNIEGDYTRYSPNCFRLEGYPEDEYRKIVKSFNKKYMEKYNIIKHIYPKIDKKYFSHKNQFSASQMIFNFAPRKENFKLVNDFIPDDKPIVILAPRFRESKIVPKGIKRRNWGYWESLYDLIYNSNLYKSYNFVICGKEGEYQRDKKNRFYDLNDITLNKNSSLVGLLLATLKRAKFTCGSQSAIPNISLLHGVTALMWGHQRVLHTRTYNIKKTPVVFIEDRNYDVDPKIVFKTLSKSLTKLERKK